MESTHALTHKGFTLVEMMVVLAIISIITSIALLGQSTFNRTLLLTNTAYTIALSVREVQTLGLSSRTFYTTAGVPVTNAGYGVHFDKSAPTSYILFADIAKTGTVPTNCAVGASGTPEAKAGDCKYNASGTVDGSVQTYTLSRGFYVKQFCGKQGLSTRYCSTDASALSLLDIAFVRSNTETAVNGYVGSQWKELDTAEIYISSADDQAQRAICINKIGQVSVAVGTCP